MQSRVVGLAGDKGALASTLNIAGFNIGTAGGAAVGGAIIAADHLRSLPWIAAVLTATAAVLAVVNNRHVAAGDPVQPAPQPAAPRATSAPQRT
jgi:DHA1 family inner membrane transport protein